MHEQPNVERAHPFLPYRAPTFFFLYLRLMEHLPRGKVGYEPLNP